MQLETHNPAALATSADRVGKINGFAAFDNFLNTPEHLATQAAAIIAHRYRITPVRARLVCELAGIGGRAR